ncbi:MAG: alanine dehydrogenase [Bacteroidales bacterium]|nr:alanine dehydrogenase [Bacteroidales bacterium]
MIQEQESIYNFSGAEGLMPKEETLEVSQRKSRIRIGVPREIHYQEKRIPLVPQGVGLLVAHGHEVLIESDAGKAADFSNEQFSNAGAHIVFTPDEIFRADVVLKIVPPSAAEIGMLSSRQTLISALHLAGQTGDYFKMLMNKKMVAVAFEYIMDKTHAYPVLRTTSEIVGNAAVMIAANYLADSSYGTGCMLGGFSGIAPTEVVILGAGTVGEFAARTALGLGASVKVFDNSVYRLRRIQNSIHERLFTSILQPGVLMSSLKRADVVIGAVHSAEGRTPLIVTEEMVQQMKKGAVIVDVSIDQGGCFETSRITSHHDPVFRKYGITHYCVPNIASSVPHTASYALSNYFAPVLVRLGEVGGITNLLQADKDFRQGVYLLGGVLTKSIISEQFHIPFQDIDLLMAAFH